MKKLPSNYGLQERTNQFGIQIIRLCKLIKPNIVSSKIIGHLVVFGTNIGANYLSAVNATFRLDFKKRILVCKKEAEETYYWLSMLRESETSYVNEIDNLIRECGELDMIFKRIINTLSSHRKNIY